MNEVNTLDAKEITPVVFLTTKKDFAILKTCITLIKERMKNCDFYVIANLELKDEIKNIDLKFIDENKLYAGLTYTAVSELLKTRGGGTKTYRMVFSTIFKNSRRLLF